MRVGRLPGAEVLSKPDSWRDSIYMRSTLSIFSRSLLGAAALVVGITAGAAHADEVTCESFNDRRNECSLYTRGGDVRVVRNLSKTNCIEGINWGYTRRGIWVDNGCRAVFSNSYGASDYRGDRYDNERERIALERERLELERQRLEQERNNASLNRGPAGRAESCPPGFRPSEQKCSPQERRRGCKDIRLPSGLGCVSR